MSKRKKGECPDQLRVGFGRSTTTLFMILSIALIAFLTYRDTLGYFFTATDTLTLIDTSRIQSLGDVTRIFTEPMMNETAFVEIAKFYRPITTLSYSLDYSIWKLNPFGYQLTNLILHILVTTLVFLFVYALTTGRQAIAWLSAVVFTTHPVLVETVPATARRSDIIAALFLLLSLLLFLRHLSTVSRTRGFLLCSILFSALALGAKEIAIILPLVIFAHLAIFSEERSPKIRITRALKASISYFVVAFVLLAWRTYVLKGLGGYVNTPFGIINLAPTFIDIIRSYSGDVLYPVDFLKLLWTPVPKVAQSLISLGALTILVVLLVLRGRSLLGTAKLRASGRLMKIIDRLSAGGVIISLAGIFALPWIGPLVNKVVEKAYYDEGPQFLTSAMEGRHSLPLEFYFQRAQYLILAVFLFTLVFSVIWLSRHEANRFLTSTSSGRLITFCSIWVCLPLGIYLASRTFSHRSMYTPVIPFSIILSTLVVGGFQSIRDKWKARKDDTSPASRSKLMKHIPSLLIAGGLLLSLLLYSPLPRDYQEWDDSGKISAMFLCELSELVPKLPNDATIHIYNLPDGISSYEARIPHAKEVAYLADYSIKSWLDLNYPSNDMKVVIDHRSRPATLPNDLCLEIEPRDDLDIAIRVKLDGTCSS